MNNKLAIMDPSFRDIRRIDNDHGKMKIDSKKAKISVFGCNLRSVNIVSAMLLEHIPAEIYVFDEDEVNLAINFEDLKYFKIIDRNLYLRTVTDIEKTANSDICIICFTHEIQNNKYNLEILFQDILLYEKYVPKIVKYSPKTIIIVATFPYSMLVHYCVKFSKIPENRILGLGSSVNSQIFRYLIANDLDISSTNVRGWVMGCICFEEETQKFKYQGLPLWSTVSVGSVQIGTLLDLSYFKDHTELVTVYTKKLQEYKISFKSVFTVGSVVCAIVETILTDGQVSFSISCNVRGFYGVNFTAYMGLPCVIGRNGYELNIKINLLQIEAKAIRKAAEKLVESSKLLHEKYIKYKTAKIKDIKAAIKDEIN